MFILFTITFVSGHICYDTATPLYDRGIFFPQYVLRNYKIIIILPEGCDFTLYSIYILT